MKRLAGTSAAEKAEAFQVIAPVEVIRPVVVIGEFNCVVLPETHPCSSSVDWGHLEAECAVLPWLVAVRAAPSRLVGSVESTISITGLKSPANVHRTRVPTRALGASTLVLHQPAIRSSRVRALQMESIGASILPSGESSSLPPSL